MYLKVQGKYYQIQLAGIGVDDRELVSFSNNFGCTVQQWPLIYLGMPLGGNPSVISFWDPVVERVNRKLITWKKILYFFEGKNYFD